MLDIIDQVDLDDFISRRWLNFAPLILEDLICFHRFKLKLGSILPLSVAIALIDLNCMLEVLRYLIAIFSLGLCTIFLNFGKFDKLEEVLLPLSQCPESSPMR